MPPSSVTALRSGQQSPRTRPTTPYDFRRPTKLAREHVRALQMAYETFARRLTTFLTSTLRQVCQVTVGDITQQSYDEYIGALNTPTVLVPLDAEPIGQCALELSLPVALAAIDHMLGGPGGTQPSRNLTDIELSLFLRLVHQVVGVLTYALEPLVPLNFQVGQLEYNPQFLQIASAADAVVVGEFELVIGRETCAMTVCLPLAPLLPRLVTHRPRETAPVEIGGRTAIQIHAHLLDMPVEVHVRFDAAAIDSSSVLSLAVGDVVPLGHRVGAPLTIQVGTSPVARAIAGKSGTSLAALVVDSPEALSKEIR